MFIQTNIFMDFIHDRRRFRVGVGDERYAGILGVSIYSVLIRVMYGYFHCSTVAFGGECTLVVRS